MYKFQIELSRIDNCPRGEQVKAQIHAFHLVKTPIDNIDNFRPQCIKDPERTLKNSKEECMFYALSMYNSADNLKRYFCGLFAKKPHVKLEIGDCIAKANLLPEFGYYNVPNSNGHFSFWALDEFNYIDNFTIIERI